MCLLAPTLRAALVAVHSVASFFRPQCMLFAHSLLASAHPPPSLCPPCPCSFGIVDDVVTFPGRMYAFVNFRGTEEAMAATAALQDSIVPELTGESPHLFGVERVVLGVAARGRAGQQPLWRSRAHSRLELELTRELVLVPRQPGSQPPAGPSIKPLPFPLPPSPRPPRRPSPADQVPPRQEGSHPPACPGPGRRGRQPHRGQVRQLRPLLRQRDGRQQGKWDQGRCAARGEAVQGGGGPVAAAPLACLLLAPGRCHHAVLCSFQLPHALPCTAVPRLRRLDLDRDGNSSEPSPRIWLGNIAPTATSKSLHAVLGR